MAPLKQFDHIGLTVRDLEAATAFFVALGLEIEGRAAVQGDFIDTVIGIPGAHTEIVMLTPPGGGTSVELSRFVHPYPEPVPEPVGAPALGLRSLAFEVDDLQAEVDRLAADATGWSAASGGSRTSG